MFKFCAILLFIALILSKFCFLESIKTFLKIKIEKSVTSKE